MTVSPRLTRAALTFLLFGTVAALLPSQDTTALADVICSRNPQYVMRLTQNLASSTTQAPASLTIARPLPITLATFVSANSTSAFKPATTTNFPLRTLTFTLKNTSKSGRFNMGSDLNSNPVAEGQSMSYSPGNTVHSTGFYASAANMSGIVTVRFRYNQITLIDSRALTSK